MDFLKKFVLFSLLLNLVPVNAQAAAPTLEGNYDADVEFDDGDILYLGFDFPFDGMNLTVEDESFSNNDYELEYWDGDSWENFTHTWEEEDVYQDDSYLSFKWEDRPNHWEKDRIDGHDSAYMIRIEADNANLLNLIVKNLKVEFETEGGEKIKEAADSIDLDKDEDIISEKYEGNGVYTFALDADTSEDYRVTVALDGYVRKTEEVRVGKEQEIFTMEFDYTYRIHVEDEDGDALSGADVKYDGEECESLSAAYYGCAVALDNDDEELVISKSGYDTVRTDLDRTRSSETSAQITQEVTLDGNGRNNDDDDDRNNDESDLIISDVDLNSSDDLEIIIKNIGDESTPSDEDIRVHVYVNGRLERNLLITERLNENETRKITVKDEIGNEGTYTVRVEVDPEDEIDEESDSNNVLTKLFRQSDSDPDDSNDCNDFRDIEKSFAKNYIISLCEDGVIVGDDSTHFNPRDYISRAEFVRMALLSADLNPYPVYSERFNDLSSSNWAYTDMSFAVNRGIIREDAYGNVRPNEYLTRAEAVVILARTYELERWGFDQSDIPFYDVKARHWFAYAVIIMSENDVVNGYRDGSFRPGDEITREESATIIVLAEHEFND